MYYCYCKVPLTDRKYRRGYYCYVLYRVEWNGSGRLRWMKDSQSRWLRRRDDNPFRQYPRMTVTHGSFVTMRQCEKLTGILRPVCKDYLYEQYHPSPEVNYIYGVSHEGD